MKNTISKEAFFNRYDIDIREGRLGGGSFGTVYKAYDNERDEVKAIKVSEVKYINNKKFSLQSEFDATADLPVHKNIANYEAVYQIEMPNGLFDYAVMQYYPEGNLKELSQKNDLSIESKQNLIEGLIRGLKYLHDNKRIHRDIKPSNILISKRKGIYTPKIADFGLSKIVNAQEMDAFTNSFGGGTLEYSSPEQLLGEKLRYNADLWAIGIIAYELLTGTIPFSAKDISGSAEAKRKIIYQNIVNAPIPSLVDSCPAPFNEIIRQCLIKDPKKRVQTADELLLLLSLENTDLEDDDQGTIFLDLEEKKPDEIVIDSSQVNSEQNNFIQKYGKWVISLIGLCLLCIGGYYLYNQTPDIEESNLTAIPTLTNPEDAKDISAILEEDPDSQNDESIKERMKSIRLQEEKNIWKLVKEDNTVMAYEEYGILYPEGLYIDEAKKAIASLLSSANLDNEESVWAYANKNNSISAYNKYIETFKEGIHIKEAKFKVKLLQRKIDDEQWSKIKDSNSLIEFERYLKLFPDGRHKKDAIERSKIIEKDIKISKAYKEAMQINTIEALETFLSKYPKSRYKEEVEKRKRLLIEEVNKNATVKSQPSKSNTSESVSISNNVKNDIINNSEAKISPTNTDPKSQEPESEEVILKSDKDIPQVDSPIKTNTAPSLNDPVTKSADNKKLENVSAFIALIDENMVNIDPATHTLGCDDGCEDDAMPSKKVSINPIKFSKYEVSQKEYKTVMGNNPSFFSDCDECPVENISFYDAKEFIKKLNAMPDNPYKFRLPTEAEWEYAASAGTTFKYSGGNKIDAVALYKSNSNRGTSPVNSKKSNKLLIFGMSGNVYEWCESWYNPTGYETPDDKTLRVIRGGSWSSKSSDCEVKSRGKTTPDDKRPFIGMRLVREL